MFMFNTMSKCILHQNCSVKVEKELTYFLSGNWSWAPYECVVADCSMGFFSCDGRCLDILRLCDGGFDCNDGSDENGCCKYSS